MQTGIAPKLLGLRLALAVLTGVAVMAGGCTSPSEYIHNGFKVGPNYHRPPAPVADHWIDVDDPRVLSVPTEDADWWMVFSDPILNCLVQTAYQQYLPLREAAFRVLQARAQLCIAAGNLFPQTQDLYGDYQRRGLSETIANRQFTPQRWFNIWDVGFNFSWELDFWGNYRRAIEAGKADFNATIEDYDAVLVTLIGDVAQTYAQIRTLEAQLNFTRINVDLMRKTLELVKVRFQDGAVSKLDVTQSTTNLEETEALIPPLEIALRQAANRLCILLGIPPEDLEKKIGHGLIPTAPREAVVGIPCDLLRRRPDVRAAERRLAAQSAEIGVATAQLYPQITLNGTIGYQTSFLRDLFNDQSIYGSWGPSIKWPILNYGRLVNGIRVQDARFQELVATYQNKVLTADEEVENGLVAFLKSQDQVTSEAKAVEAARESVQLVLIQYKEGKVDFNRVFLLERILVQDEDKLAEAQGNVVQGLIQVYRALGGGWQIRCPCQAEAQGAPLPAPDGATPASPEILPPPQPLQQQVQEKLPLPKKAGG